jgi:hypothetical protein
MEERRKGEIKLQSHIKTVFCVILNEVKDLNRP